MRRSHRSKSGRRLAARARAAVVGPVLGAWAAVGLAPAACSSAAEPGRAETPAATTDRLAAIDASALTTREQREWQSYLGELLAPCPDVPVSIRECISEQRGCAACAPAARFLMQQVRAGRPKSQVYDLFEMRFDPARVKTIVVGESATAGSADAPITIVEFSDFQCPSCRRMALVLDELLAQYPDRVRLVYKHYPISYHTYAKLAAQAAVAAQKQGKFWPMHHVFFANPDRLTERDLKAYAESNGLDVGRFVQDLHAEHVVRQVETERKQGDGLGVRGTPTLFINGREVPIGALDDPLRDLAHWVDVELELVGQAAPGRPTAASRTAGEPAPAAAVGAAGVVPSVDAGAAVEPLPSSSVDAGQGDASPPREQRP